MKCFFFVISLQHFKWVNKREFLNSANILISEKGSECMTFLMFYYSLITIIATDQQIYTEYVLN